MSAELQIEQEAFFKRLQQLHTEQGIEDPLSRFRAKAWDHFEELGLPTPKTEVFQYIRLRQLFGKNFTLAKSQTVSKKEIESHILPECRTSCAVFVNGNLDLNLSNFEGLPKKTVAISLQEALRSFGSFINNQVAKLMQEELDPFASLNGAFVQRALFLYLPPNTIFETPFQILNVVKGKGNLISPRMEIFIGALSEANFVSTAAHIDTGDAFINSTTNFLLEEGAKVSYEKLSLNTPPTTWQFDATRATLKKDSGFNSIHVLNGAQAMRDDYRISLVGPNAEVSLNGLCMLHEKRESHTHVFMDHQAPECRSIQHFKSVVKDTARSSFEGKIYVHKPAQKTQAFQLSNNLLLSDYAHADCKPNLEIFADDVKASHGATIGQLDPEQLFYLRTRGFSLEKAKTMLIQGFCHEIIDKIPVTSVLKQASNYI